MNSTNSAQQGAIIRPDSFIYSTVDQIDIAEPVGPRLGATMVRLQVVRVPAGHTWCDRSTSEEENVTVVFSGAGLAGGTANGQNLSSGGAMYAPTGTRVEFTAAPASPTTLYIWRTLLQPGRKQSKQPKLFGTLWDTETQLKNFMGTGQAPPEGKPATMNFVFWPGVGCSQLCLHCGIMEPGEAFNVHIHPESDEAFIAFHGQGDLYLYDRWHPASAGDILFAPPGIHHGTRNPSKKQFITCGGPTPFDPVLYKHAGVSAEVK